MKLVTKEEIGKLNWGREMLECGGEEEIELWKMAVYKRSILAGVLMVVVLAGCQGQKKADSETLKMKAVYRFLLERLQEDDVNLIASENDEDLRLIEEVVADNKMGFKVVRYDDIEMGAGLCYYTKSGKKLVAVVDVTDRGEDRYYVSYYIGPEGGASKEIKMEKRDARWVVAGDDGKWNVK